MVDDQRLIDEFRDRIFKAELDAVTNSRKHRLQRPPAPDQASDAAQDSYQRADDARLFGLALSGGGIRSATFNLGVIQALAKLGLLRYVDYLSTVSGGGYIGAWMTAWASRRKSATQGADYPSGIERIANMLGVGLQGGTNGAEPQEVRSLREYSNFLTPKKSFFGADTWTSIAIFLRNLSLMQTVVILMLGLLLCVPHLFSYSLAVQQTLSWGVSVTVLGVFCAVLLYLVLSNHKKILQHGLVYALVTIFVALVGPHLLAGSMPLTPAKLISFAVLAVLSIFMTFLALAKWNPQKSEDAQIRIQLKIVIPLMAAAYLFTQVLRVLPKEYAWWPEFIFAAIAVMCWCMTVWLAARTPLKRRLYFFATSFVAAFLVAFLARPVANFFGYLDGLNEPVYNWGSELTLVVGPPLLIQLFSAVLVLQIGLAGRAFSDQSLEWWSRLGGWLFIYSFSWMAIFGVALLGPDIPALIEYWVSTQQGQAWLKTFWSNGGDVSMGAGGVVGWLLISIWGVYSAQKNNTDAQNASRLSLISRSAPYVFIFGLLLLIATGLDWLIEWLWPCISSAQLSCGWQLGMEEIIAVVALILLGWFTWKLDINRFSLHNYYKNRLVRCYLGASNASHEQDADHFTGFADSDDIEFGAVDQRETPLHIINAAVNLSNVGNLAWQERKAASFFFTPLYSGYQFPSIQVRNTNPAIAQPYVVKSGVGGFQSTLDYSESEQRKHIMLGTCMAISGAAASPNMGFRTTPALAFLMTVLNVRLGWWLPNPSNKVRKLAASPPLGGFKYLLMELFGLTNENSNYVHLSDGGHFENLGVYELVRRRCRYIVVCDAGQDKGSLFDDLGNAIRKCRADFGVEINLDTEILQPDPNTGISKQHCVVGSIHYPCVDKEPERGIIVYIKPTLTGDEPQDILNYKAQHNKFPHESTMDQWFSESQFESYRRLGFHIGEEVFQLAQDCVLHFDGEEDDHLQHKKPSNQKPKIVPLHTFFDLLTRIWMPSSQARESQFSKHGQALDELLQRQKDDPHLDFLDKQFYPEWSAVSFGAEGQPVSNFWLPDDYAQRRAGFYFCNSLIQFMENVYTDLNLEQEYDHPDNRGWMNLFKHWSWSGMFRITWSVSACTYGTRFQRFCAHRLELFIGKVEAFVHKPSHIQEGNLVSDQTVQVATISRIENQPMLTWLNFLENKIVQNIFENDANKEYWAEQDGKVWLVSLQIVISDPRAANNLTHNRYFTFGFALIQAVKSPQWNQEQRNSLVYFRVQDHLRNMGLTRRALKKILCLDALPVSEASLPLWDEYSSFDEEAKRYFTRMFYALRQELSALQE